MFSIPPKIHRILCRSACVEPILIEADLAARSLLREFNNRAVDRVRPGGDLRDVDNAAAFSLSWALSVSVSEILRMKASGGKNAPQCNATQEIGNI
jgi:hypothetical protein